MTLEDELFEAFDRVVHEDYPNPKRVNCPGHSALQKLAAESQAVLYASTLVHIRQCAPCFDELRELHQRWTRQHP